MVSAARVTAPRKRRIQSGRQFVAVDIENVVGGAVHCAAMTTWAYAQVQEMACLAVGDHVVVGTSRFGMPHIGWDWPGARIVMQSGPDGADLALLDVLAEDIADRFDEVVLFSGDGIFTQAVAALGGAGVKVVVVAHPDGLSKRLAMAAGEVRLLPARWDAGFGVLGGTA